MIDSISEIRKQMGLTTFCVCIGGTGTGAFTLFNVGFLFTLVFSDGEFSGLVMLHNVDAEISTLDATLVIVLK